jgi:hypothetical protein
MSCSSVEVHRLLEENISSIFRVEEKDKRENSNKQVGSSALLAACLLHGIAYQAKTPRKRVQRQKDIFRVV